MNSLPYHVSYQRRTFKHSKYTTITSTITSKKTKNWSILQTLSFPTSSAKPPPSLIQLMRLCLLIISIKSDRISRSVQQNNETARRTLLLNNIYKHCGLAVSLIGFFAGRSRLLIAAEINVINLSFRIVFPFWLIGRKCEMCFGLKRVNVSACGSTDGAIYDFLWFYYFFGIIDKNMILL